MSHFPRNRRHMEMKIPSNYTRSSDISQITLQIFSGFQKHFLLCGCVFALVDLPFFGVLSRCYAVGSRVCDTLQNQPEAKSQGGKLETSPPCQLTYKSLWLKQNDRQIHSKRKSTLTLRWRSGRRYGLGRYFHYLRDFCSWLGPFQ